MAPSTQLQTYLILPSPSFIRPYTILAHPNAVDTWLNANRDDAWTNPLIPGYLFLTDTACDQVLCMIQLSQGLLLTDNTFEDWYKYNLVVYVETPEASGVDLSYLSSPLATIGRYEGFNSDIDAPEWTCMEVNRPLQFRQPRGAMAEVFMKLAFWTENAEIPSLSQVMLEWAMANAVGTPAHSRIKMPITPECTPPRARSIPRKPKARKSGDTSCMASVDETPTHRVTRSMAALRVAST